MGALPLALAQAAAYIRETHCGIATYLLSYETAWNDLMEDESHPDFAPREYDYRSVYTTWNVSFECVKQKNEDAANMLQLWSYLDNKDIWYSLFNNEQNCNLEYWDSLLPQWFERVVGREVDFRRAVRILLAYSLIEAKEDSDAFAMHPVVHDWCRETLDAGMRHEFMWLAITVVGFTVPHNTERSYWEIELRLLPHARRCIVLLDNVVEESLQRDDLLELNRAVWCLGKLSQDQLRLAEAEAMYQWALKTDKKHSEGEVDPDPDLTARIHNSLGILYMAREKLDKAETMCQRALTGFEKLSGSDTKDTMMVINNLGIIYKRQGKLAEAEAMYKRALAWYTETLGSDHVDTVGTVSNLALVYRAQGNLAEAESSLKRVLVVQENELGPKHPRTLSTVYSLGVCHRDQEKFMEAEVQFKRALSGREKVLGSDHTVTLNACFMLGRALFAQERFMEAEVQFKRALSGREKVLGPDHINTLDACYMLGGALFVQERFMEAEVQFERALSGCEKVLGLDHTVTLDACYMLGMALNAQEKLVEAEVQFKRALSGNKNNKNYEWAKEATAKLSEIYKKQGRLAEAEAMWRPLLADFEATLGPDDELTVEVCFEIGWVLMVQGKLLEAEAMCQRALSGYKKVLGMDHESTVVTSYNLGLVLKRQRKLHEAEDIFQQAFSGYQKIRGTDHQYTKDAAFQLNKIYKEQGRHEEAEAILQSVA